MKYRDANLPPSDLTEEQRIFDDDCIDNDECPIISGNDSTRPLGRPSNDEREYRLQGLILRDKLRLKLEGCDMHRPRKEEWEYSNNSGAARINT